MILMRRRKRERVCEVLDLGWRAEVIAKNGLQPAIVANSSVSSLTNAVDSRLEKIYSKTRQ